MLKFSRKFILSIPVNWLKIVINFSVDFKEMKTNLIKNGTIFFLLTISILSLTIHVGCEKDEDEIVEV